MSVTYAYSGKIEKVTVQTTGLYEISAYGGQGGAGVDAGGLGAEESGAFQLVQGEVLELIVGGAGQDVRNFFGGGGGGTFILANIGAGGSYVPLLVAGGGGGGGYNVAGGNGTATGPSGDGSGGTAGASGHEYAGGGGAGVYGNGGKAGYFGGLGGYSPQYGAVGGVLAGPAIKGGSGGFGGGGGAGYLGPGGGGGFTGGNGGYYQGGVAGTGGTSYARAGATSVVGLDGVNTGAGKIVIGAEVGDGTIGYLTLAGLPVVNVARYWDGSNGDFYDASHWATGVDPAPGDTVYISSGIVSLVGSEARVAGSFNDNPVYLGIDGQPTATLDLQSAVAGRAFSITVTGDAAVLATGGGVSDVEGGITAGHSGATLTLGSTDGGALVFSTYGAVTVSNRENLVFTGDTTFANLHGLSTDATVTTENDGTVDFVGGQAGDTFGGAVASDAGDAGVFNLEFGATLTFNGSVSSQETIVFNGAANDLVLGNLAGFAGAVENFSSGNSIDFTDVSADGVYYDSQQNAIYLSEGGSIVATLDDVTAQPGSLTTTADASGTGTIVSYAGAESTTKIELAAADQAMGSDVVRATMTVPGTTTAITGAGIKIGIISNSFDVHFQAAANEAAGYLPNVTVLQEGPSNQDDEGQAMAELIHQVAPDAQLYFATGVEGQADFASNVEALLAAGCNIIVDDIGYFLTAQYQVAGTLVSAVNAAVQGGVNYFTAAGNFSHSFYQGSFSGQTETLRDGSIVDANIFNNGTPYEAVNIAAGTTPYIQVNWTAPFEGSANQGAPDDLTFKMFDASGKLIAASQQTLDGVATASTFVIAPSVSTAQTYYLAVYNSSAAALPAGFGFSLDLTENGAVETIDDASAYSGNGNVNGQALVPGVNTVGAIYYGQSAADGQTPSANEGFSSSGPGELLYDSNGNPITPISAGKVNFSAPDGVNVAVNGFAPFYGTSAAAPNAAAVAALMLQADGRLTNTQISYLLAHTATPIADGSAAVTGAGLVQAPGAVGAAIMAATTPIWTAQGDGVAWSDAANWSDNATPGATDAVMIDNGDGQLSGAYSTTDNIASVTVQSLTVDGGATATPTLVIASGDTLEVTGDLTIAHTGSIDLRGSLKLDGASSGGAGAINFDSVDGGDRTLDLTSEGRGSGFAFHASASNFAVGDKILVAGASGDFIGYENGMLEVEDHTGVLQEKFAANSAPGGFSLTYDSSTGFDTIVADAVCYCRGTRILTQRGEIAVECLAIGDIVVTASGEGKPVRWIGLQTVSRRFADPLRILPIRIKAGALGVKVPSRDLLLSPAHAVLIGDVLIQAGALVNNFSIVRETDVPEIFTYYNVEIDDHALILAENTPAETFIDNVDRVHFDNWAEHEALHPDGKEMAELPYPRAKSHRQVPIRVRAMLADRAMAIWAPTRTAAA